MNREKAREVFLGRFETAIRQQEDAERRDSLVCIEKHSQRVAEVAETIAEKAGMDAERAYVCGLLHDIGKASPGWQGGLDHAAIGYKMLLEEGDEEAAGVALTHTFYAYGKADMEGFWARMELEDIALVQEYMEGRERSEVELLVQMVDNMVRCGRAMTISDRFCDILVRHNLHDAGAQLRVLYGLKEHFDKRCGMNIYELFRDEIIEAAMQEPNKGEDDEI